MSAKTVFATALVLTLGSLSAVRGQTPGFMGPVDPFPPTKTYGATGMAPLGDTLPPPKGYGPSGEMLPPPQPQGEPLHQLSSWIRGDKYSCCDEIGGSGKIQEELFFRIGPTVVAGTGTIADVLQTGLYLGAGGRTLFFDPSMTHAWTIELGLAYFYNHAHFPNTYTGIPLNILVPQNPNSPVTPRDATGNLPPVPVSFGKGDVPGVTLKELHRAFLDLGPGYEWYLIGSAGCKGPSWRIGCDGGGRWGSASADFNEIRHRTDVIGGLWAAAHTDLEIPCGCCLFQVGFRVEYGYTWSDILQIQNKSDVQDIGFLFNIGVRF